MHTFLRSYSGAGSAMDLPIHLQPFIYVSRDEHTMSP